MGRCMCMVLLGATWLPTLVVAAPGAPFPGTGDGATAHEWLEFLHICLFVFWLGPDVAVYAWSRRIADTSASAEQRIVAAQMMSRVEMIPRVAMSLMLTVGGLLSEYVGLTHPWWQMAGIVLLGPVWLTLVLLACFRDGTPFGSTAARLDTVLRLLLVVAIPASVAYSTLTGRLAVAPYVGAKLLLFAAIVLLGLLQRARLAPLRAALATLAATGPTPAVDAAVQSSLARSRPYAVGIWVALLVAALMGVVRFGAPPSPAAARVTAMQARPGLWSPRASGEETMPCAGFLSGAAGGRSGLRLEVPTLSNT